jgi:predicted nucleic acid-binding Zn ribbon protein
VDAAGAADDVGGGGGVSGGERRRPTTVGEVLASVLERAGLTGRVAQAGVIPAWPALVGAQIAEVTEPVRLQGDGTLVVRVRSHAWMQELSLLEPELLRALNGDPGRPPVARLRWVAW